MSTTLSDLRSKLRAEMKTDPSGKIWGDSQITDFANQAYLQIQVDGQFNWPANQGTSGIVSLTQGTREYSLPSDFGRLELAMLSTTKLWEIDFTDAILRNPTSSQSTPSTYYIRASNMGFDPVPSGTATVTLYYRKVLTSLSADADLIAFPDSFAPVMVQYMAYLAWNGPRGNADGAAKHLATYDEGLSRLFGTYQLRDTASLQYKTRRGNYSMPYRSDTLHF